nr:hypothetical protein [uncultured Campylobacter sp.]
MWLEEFKIALVNEDIEAIEALADKVPAEFKNIEEALQAQTLVGEAINLIQKSKADLSKEFEKLKNVKKYISS